MIVTLVLGLGLLWFGLSEPPSASASAPAQVETNTPPPWRVEIYEQVNVRAGPGTQYDLVGILIPGQTSEVIGRSTTGTWLKIVYVGGPDNAGWVLREFVRVVGDSPNMPTIEAPPSAKPKTIVRRRPIRSAKNPPMRPAASCPPPNIDMNSPARSMGYPSWSVR